MVGFIIITTAFKNIKGKLSKKDMLCNIKININSNSVYTKAIDLGEYLSKIRLIPFMSLGKENGMLIGIKADGLTVNTQEDVVFIKNIIIGIYDGSLSKTGKYRALIGLELLENKGGNEENEHIRTVKI